MDSFTSNDILYHAPLLANDPLRFWFIDKFFIDMGITIATDDSSTTKEARLPADEQESRLQGQVTSEFNEVTSSYGLQAPATASRLRASDAQVQPIAATILHHVLLDSTFMSRS